MIKFNRHHVTNGTVKARVFYSLDNRADRRPCVTLFGKDYSDALAIIGRELGHYHNDTDITTDYFDQGRIVLFADSPYYAEARARVEAFRAGR